MPHVFRTGMYRELIGAIWFDDFENPDLLVCNSDQMMAVAFWNFTMVRHGAAVHVEQWAAQQRLRITQGDDPMQINALDVLKFKPSKETLDALNECIIHLGKEEALVNAIVCQAFGAGLDAEVGKLVSIDDRLDLMHELGLPSHAVTAERTMGDEGRDIIVVQLAKGTSSEGMPTTFRGHQVRYEPMTAPEAL